MRWLLWKLKHGSKRMQLQAVGMLATQGPRAIPVLLNTIASSNSSDLVRAARSALDKVENWAQMPESIAETPHLIDVLLFENKLPYPQCLRVPDTFHNQEVIISILGAIGGPKAVSALVLLAMRWMERTPGSLRNRAAEDAIRQVGRISDPAATTSLLDRALTDCGVNRLRLCAGRELLAKQDARVVPVMAALLDDPEVAGEARKALDTFNRNWHELVAPAELLEELSKLPIPEAKQLILRIAAIDKPVTDASPTPNLDAVATIHRVGAPALDELARGVMDRALNVWDVAPLARQRILGSLARTRWAPAMDEQIAWLAVARFDKDDVQRLRRSNPPAVTAALSNLTVALCEAAQDSPAYPQKCWSRWFSAVDFLAEVADSDLAPQLLLLYYQVCQDDLIRTRSSFDKNPRAHVVKALARIDREFVLPLVLEDLTNYRVTRPVSTVWLLGDLGDARVIKPLIELGDRYCREQSGYKKSADRYDYSYYSYAEEAAAVIRHMLEHSLQEVSNEALHAVASMVLTKRLYHDDTNEPFDCEILTSDLRQIAKGELANRGVSID